MGTITCELEASYAAGTAGNDDKGTTIPHQLRRRVTFAGNGKGKGRRLGDGGGSGTLAAGSWSWCSSMFLRRRSNTSISMQVFVRTLAGKSLALDVSPYDTVDAVKAKIQGKELVAAAEQRLVFAGRDLDDGGRTLADYGVRKEANLFLHLRLRGGTGGDVCAGGSHSHHSWSTAVGLLATVVAVAAALPYLPGAAEEKDSGSLTPAFLLVVWAIAVGGVNLIIAGTACTSGTTSSRGARSALSKAATFARQNIAVLGPSASSTAAAGITFSGADPVLSFVCFVLFLGAMSLTLFLVFAAGRHLDGGVGRKTSGGGTSTAAAGTGSSRRVTAAGLLAALVAVGTALTCFFPEPAEAAGAGSLTFAMLLFSWSLAVAGVNMIAAGVCLSLTGGSGRDESLISCTVLIRKASAFAGQNLGVLGVAAASSATAGVVVSGADADGWVYCFAWFSLFLVAMSGVTAGIASRKRS